MTVSLVPQARGGPFVFWDDFPAAAAQAAELGFSGIEVFAPSGEILAGLNLGSVLKETGLRLAAVGTGGGWLIHRLTLCDPDATRRQAACDFVRKIIDAGGPHGAPAIVGSMQGRHGEGNELATARGYLSDSLHLLSEHARSYNVPLLYEPLNRYETNFANTQAAGVELIKAVSPTANLRLLADLFHMNIEEANSAQALRDIAPWLGHVHFADSNRRAAGFGQMNFAPIIAVLRDVEYSGWLSAEVFSWPDAHGAAQKTIETFRRVCP